MGRRTFLVLAGNRMFGVAVLGLAGCSAEADSGHPSGLAWSRVDRAYVSAYVLVRGVEAAVVDTGVGGSADRIGAALQAAGSGWDNVRAVVVTHAHFDHIGSVPEVAGRAPWARLYAGALDLPWLRDPLSDGSPGVPLDRRICTAIDGEEIFGLHVVATPGHTQGHVAVSTRTRPCCRRRRPDQHLRRGARRLATVRHDGPDSGGGLGAQAR